MKRLYLTVEGQTEAAFAVRVLSPHLASFNVFLHQPRFTGLHRRRVGHIPKGGLLGTFRHTLSDIRIWLKVQSSQDARFSMMVDLYGLPRDFPGFNDALAPQNGWDRAVALETALAQELGDSRFIPYVQVHEFEALVLAKPTLIGELYPGHDAKLRSLSEECSRFRSPEEINHGTETHPKSRIQRCVPGYDENVAGPLLTEEIGIQTLRSRCPHFGTWLDRLERLDRDVEP